MTSPDQDHAAAASPSRPAPTGATIFLLQTLLFQTCLLQIGAAS